MRQKKVDTGGALMMVGPLRTPTPVALHSEPVMVGPYLLATIALNGNQYVFDVDTGKVIHPIDSTRYEVYNAK